MTFENSMRHVEIAMISTDQSSICQVLVNLKHRDTVNRDKALCDVC